MQLETLWASNVTSNRAAHPHGAPNNRTVVAFRTAARLGVLLGCVALSPAASSCIPKVTEQNVRTARQTDDPVEHRKDSQSVRKLTAEVQEDVVQAQVVRVNECRDISTSRWVMDVGVRRNTPQAVSSFLGNVVLTGALAAGGAYIYSAAGTGSCTKPGTATGTQSSPAERPCTADEATEEKQTQQAEGVLTAALALIPAVILFNNFSREADDIETTPLAPRTEETPWRVCSEPKPVSGAVVEMRVGSLRLSATTNADGLANFDLSEIAGSTTEPTSAVVVLPKADGAAVKDVTLALAGTPSYVAWTTARAEARAAAEAQTERTRAEWLAAGKREQLRIQLENHLGRLRGWDQAIGRIKKPFKREDILLVAAAAEGLKGAAEFLQSSKDAAQASFPDATREAARLAVRIADWVTTNKAGLKRAAAAIGEQDDRDAEAATARQRAYEESPEGQAASARRERERSQAEADRQRRDSESSAASARRNAQQRCESRCPSRSNGNCAWGGAGAPCRANYDAIVDACMAGCVR